MIFRQAQQQEKNLLFRQGYIEWSKNRSFQQYCMDNSKEDAFGTRYILEKNGDIVCSAILLRLKEINGKKVFGIGSVLTPQDHRGNSYASELLRNCIKLVYDDNSMIFLYSDIKPAFYEKLNFRLLPTTLQRYEKSPCMVLCKDEIWRELLTCNVNVIPNYF